MTSTDAMSQKDCYELKREFVTAKFKPEVTLAAAQCMKFKERYELWRLKLMMILKIQLYKARW